MSDLNSIENLLNPTDDEESVTGLFAKKQNEIKLKEVEKQTEKYAQQAGLDYINLFGFPISPEALVLIPEEKAKEIYTVCFLYDGHNIHVGNIYIINLVVQAFITADFFFEFF